MLSIHNSVYTSQALLCSSVLNIAVVNKRDKNSGAYVVSEYGEIVNQRNNKYSVYLQNICIIITYNL